VNDLDVKIVRNGTTTLPWILNSFLYANATRVDNLNNIEQITPILQLVPINYRNRYFCAFKYARTVVYDYVAELV
jgi:hypothetical protein